MSSAVPSQHRESVPTIEEARERLEREAGQRHYFGQMVEQADLRVLLASEAQLRDDLRELLEAMKPVVALARDIEQADEESTAGFPTPDNIPTHDATDEVLTVRDARRIFALYEKHNKEKDDAPARL